MKSKFSALLLVLLSLTASAWAQTYPVTDSFSGTGPLSSNWTKTTETNDFPGTLVQAAGKVVPSPLGSLGFATYTGAPFLPDQYAQVTVTVNPAGGNDNTGPCVRTDTNGNGYCYIAQNGQVQVLKANAPIANGIPAYTIIIHWQNCPVAKVGETVRISAVGTVVTCTDVTTGISASVDTTTTDRTKVIIDNFVPLTGGQPGMMVDQITNTGGLPDMSYSVGSFQADCIPGCNLDYPVADSFTGTGPLSSNWTNTTAGAPGMSYPYVALVRTTDTVVPNKAALTSTSYGMATYTGVQFTADQVAQVKFVSQSASGDGTGPCVSMSVAGTGYCYAADSGQVVAFYLGLNSGAAPISCPKPSSGDTIQLSIVGGMLTCSDLTTGISATGSGVPGFYTNGAPGIFVDQRTAANPTLTSFRADCVPTCYSGPPYPTGIPTFNPNTGIYNGTQEVVLNSYTLSPTMYYTTDGTTPTTSSTVYTGPIAVAATETINVLATAVGYLDSAIGTATYTLQVATPTFDPLAGNYITTQNVVLSTTTPGATIYYTTDGSTPTTSSTPYATTPIPVGTPETIKAIAVISGYTSSDVAVANYTFTVPPAVTPTFSPAAGTLSGPTAVTISSASPSASIYYTTDGSDPTTGSAAYSSAVMVSANETIKAIATAPSTVTSAVGTAVYNFAAGTPTFSPGSGLFSAATPITISSATPGTTIYYTTDGSAPTSASPVYSGAVSITPPTTLKAIATNSGYADSAIGTAVYTNGTRTLTSVGLFPQAVSLQKGSSHQFTVVCNYSDSSTDNCAAAGGVTWSSSTLTAMSVDSTGLVTWNSEPGSGGVGSSFVVVSAGSGTNVLKDKAAVYGQHVGDTWYTYPTPQVSSPTNNVAVGSTVTVGEYLDDITVDHTGSPFQSSCNWSSSDTTIATVTRYGQVTGIAPGAVTITCGRVGDAAFGIGAAGAGNTISLNVVTGGPVVGVSNTTWYVRPDGGTLYNAASNPTGQCNGQSNQSYAAAGGTGTNQACAVGNIRDLWADALTYGVKRWVIAGGDTVIVAQNSAGYNIGGESGGFINCPGDPYGCFMPSIPSGTQTQHTKILGENYANCHEENNIKTSALKTLLNVTYAASAGINVTDSQFVDIACFEVTDAEACADSGNFTNNCHGSSLNYGGSGIIESALSSNVNYTDMFIHGLTGAGIHGATGVGVVADHVHIRAMASAGIDMDDQPWGSGNVSVAGGFTMTNSITEFTGCVEEYPVVHEYPYIECRDENSGGYSDAFGTGSTTGDWHFDHDTWQYNYQDGLDLLHSGMQNLVITNSLSMGNIGQSYKIGSADTVVFQNNIAMDNCRRTLTLFGDEPASAIEISPATYNPCRASGDWIVLSFTDVGTYKVQANTFVGYGATPFDMGCEGGWDFCTHANAIYQDNLYMGYANPAYQDDQGRVPGLFYAESPLPPNDNWAIRDHNIYFNLRDGYCPSPLSSETCTADPLFIDEPASPISGETALDGFNFMPSAASPAIGAGVALPDITTDRNGKPRANPPTIGAIEVTPPAPSVITVTINPTVATVGTSVAISASVASSGSYTPTGTVTFKNNGNDIIGIVTLDSTGVGTFNTTSLAAGTYTVTASYPGDPNYQAGVSTPAVTLTINLPPPTQIGTTTVLTAGPNPGTVGQNVMLTATVAPVSGTGVPTGTVTFYNGANSIGTGMVNAQGVATYTTGSLPVGPNNALTATYGGDTGYLSSTSDIYTEAVNPQPAATTTTLGASPNTANVGDTVTLTATVAPASGSGTPTGTVTFYYGATALNAVPAQVVSGVASYPTSSLPAGSDSLTAVYTGDTNFATSTSAPVIEVISTPLPPAPVTTTTVLGAAPSPANVGDSVTLTATVTPASGTGMTGTVTFKSGGVAIGTGTVTGGVASYSTSSLAAGSDTLTAVYSGDANFQGSTSSPVTEVVNTPAPPPLVVTMTTMTANPNPATVGASILLAASVTSASGTGMTGTVTFMNGSTVLNATPAPVVAGVATFNTSSLPAGSNSLTAVYSGDTTFAGSTSSVAVELIGAGTPPNFQITATASSMSIAQSSTGTMTMLLTTTGGYTGTVNLSCATSSAAITCSVAPPAITFTTGGSTAQISTLSVVTSADAGSIFASNKSNSPSMMLALLLPGSLLGLFGLRRRGYGKSLRRLALLLLLSAGVIGAASLTGCGSGISSNPEPRNYTVTVTASDSTTSTTSTVDVSVK